MQKIIVSLKYLLKFVKVYIILLVIFLVSLITVCLIPARITKDNLGGTVTTFKNEGIYPSFGIPIRQILLDNYTDALMMNIALSVDSSDPLRSALVNPRHSRIDNSADQITYLEDIYLEKETETSIYERYWHGYLIFLRPMISVVPYWGVRIFNMLLLLTSAVYLLYLIQKKFGIKVSLAFLIGFIFIDFPYLGLSMQFSNIFLLGLFSAIYLLKRFNKIQDLNIYFFIIGGLTAFFDLLTAPLIPLGMALIIVVNYGVRNVKQILSLCILWTTGYLTIWYAKWLIVQTLYVPKAVKVAIDQILNRTVTPADANFSHLKAVSLNFFQLIGYNRINKFIVFSFGLLAVIFVLKYLKVNRKRISRGIPWIFVGLIPYVWYLISANHSYLHVWFTYRNQFLSVSSGILFIWELIDWPKVQKDFLFVQKLLSAKKSTI